MMCDKTQWASLIRYELPMPDSDMCDARNLVFQTCY